MDFLREYERETMSALKETYKLKKIVEEGFDEDEVFDFSHEGEKIFNSAEELADYKLMCGLFVQRFLACKEEYYEALLDGQRNEDVYKNMHKFIVESQNDKSAEIFDILNKFYYYYSFGEECGDRYYDLDKLEAGYLLLEGILRSVGFSIGNVKNDEFLLDKELLYLYNDFKNEQFLSLADEMKFLRENYLYVQVGKYFVRCDPKINGKCEATFDIHIFEEYSFKGCKNLEEVSFWNENYIIKPYAFCDCENLSKIDFNKIREIGDYAFFNCGFQELNFQYDNIKFSSGAFSCNKKLKKLFLPATRNVPSEFVCGCENLKEIEVASESRFGYKCFSSTAIERIKLYDITEIPEACFLGCEQLKEVFISNSYYFTLRSICDEAFGRCKNLKVIHFYSIKDEWSYNIMFGEKWASGTKNLVVECVDGSINIECV